MTPATLSTTAAILSLLGAPAAAEIQVDADWNATVVSTVDGSSVPIGGAVSFEAAFAPFPPYTFLDGPYTVTLETADFVHGTGGGGAVLVTSSDAHGAGTWEATWAVVSVPEPANAALLLAGLGLVAALARRTQGSTTTWGAAPDQSSIT